jgi:two-component system phosphate regulon sensor histidine kinase PhoR
MFKWGIRNRLIVSYLIIVLITLLPLGGYILWYFDRHNMQSLTANLLAQAQITQELMADYMSTPDKRASLDALVKELTTKVELHDLRITVIDLNGVVLADSWEDPATMENHGERPEVLAALESGYGETIRFSTTLEENLLYVAVPIKSDDKVIGVVRISNTLAHVEQGFREIRYALLTALFAISLLAVAGSIRLARNYTTPLEEITKTAEQIAEGHLDNRVHVKTGDELQILAHTLNQLASNLDDKVNEITTEKSKLELLWQHTNSAIILLNQYGQVIKINKVAAEKFQIVENMIGLHNLQVVGNSIFNSAVQETITHAHSRLIDLKTDLKGNKHAYQVFLAPIDNPDGAVSAVLAVFHDITTLQEIHDKQAEFVANASHELATPLTAIKGFAETLLDGALKDPELGPRFVEIIQSEAERMHRLVKNLLQMAKLNTLDYQKSIKLEPTLVQPLISGIVKNFEPQWANKQLTVELAAPSAPLAVLANVDWLKQVIINLLENSIKYTSNGGKIILKWWQDGNDVVFAVEDSGVGIPSQDLPRIFERFYRVDRARTRSAGGTGLGLAIVKFIVEMLGGTIEAKSELGIGTTMIFRLPKA